MIVHADWQHDEVLNATAENGNTITIDANSAHVDGPGPLEIVLMGLCSCTSVDVVSILKKKRQHFTGLRVTAQAEQAPTPPRVFVRIHLIYTVHGTGLSRKAVEDSVALSKNKYCSASIMLGKAAEIDYEIVYPDGEPEP